MSLIARARYLISVLSHPDFTSARRKKAGAARGRALYLEALEERQLMTVTIPTLTNVSLSTIHDTTVSFTASEFTSHYSDPAPLASIIIETPPGHGNLTVGGVAVSAGNTISIAAISTMVYTPNAGYAGPDTFVWNASDGANNAAQNKNVNISVVDTPPAITTLSLTTSHSQAITFNAAEFTGRYSDAEGDVMASITLVSLPHGTLQLNGSAVSSNAVITTAQIGSLTYTPDVSFSGTDSFLWSASDGIFNSKNANVTLTVQESAPKITSFSAVPGESEAVSFLNGSSNFFALQFTDVNAGDSLQSIKILSTPGHGTLTLSDGTTVTPVTINQIITAAEIPNLVYTPAAGYVGKDSFKWTASDGTFSSSSAIANFDIRYFTVTANNNVLANGSKSPTANAFTDFGFASTTGPSLTRTFTINDVGSANLNLTGAGNLVNISGANAGDFVVTTQPDSSSLTNGQSTTFTITFTAHGTGTRNATVTIANSAPGQSPFTFAIKGTALSTLTTPDGLIVQKTVTGSGLGANNLDELAVNYTGTLLDGTVFDSSLLPGRTPLELSLGQGQVIAGWDEGLQNIRAGETRVLIIPSALGYGSTGHGTGPGSVPPNATMIFVVTCLQIGRPALVLTGNNLLMSPGDNSPSALDGTNFGTLPPGTNAITHTWVITDGGAGSLGFPTGNPAPPAITITGANAADFTPSTIGFSSDSQSANFTVAFKPLGPGVRTAVVHVHTNDPNHPDFAFTVQGTINYTDLAASLGNVVLPTPSTVIGGNTTLIVPVVVTNVGAQPVPSSTPNATITVMVHDNDNNQDTPLATFPNQNVSGLGLNKSKTFNESITLPPGFDADHSTITAVITADATHPIIETNPITNTVVTNNTFVGAISSDLTGALVSTTLLPQVVINATQNGNIIFNITNTGNAALPSNQKVNITITAIETTSNAVIPLANLVNQSIGSLAGGATKTFTVKVNSNITFPEGTYDIHVSITPAPGIPGEDSTNNDISTTAAAAPLTIVSSDPFDDISGAILSSTIPISGGNTGPVKGNISLKIINAANRALPSGQQVQVQILAHNTDTTTPDIVLATTAAISLSSWSANKSQTFTIPVNYLAGLDIAHYQIEALITPLVQLGKPALVESSTDNNLLTTKPDNSAILFNSQTPVNDFTVNLGTSTIKSQTPNTKLSGSVTVQILNAGNIPLPSVQHATISIIAHLASDGTDRTNDVLLQTSATISLANLATGAPLTFKVPVSFAAGLPAGDYQIQTLINPVESLTLVNLLDAYGTVTLANAAITLTIS